MTTQSVTVSPSHGADSPDSGLKGVELPSDEDMPGRNTPPKPVYMSSKLCPNHQYLVSPEIDDQDLKREPDCILYNASLMVDAIAEPDRWILLPHIPFVIGSEHYLPDQHLRFHYVYLVHPDSRKLRACIGVYEYDLLESSSSSSSSEPSSSLSWLVPSRLLQGAKTLNLDKAGYPLLFPFVTESFLYKAGIPDPDMTPATASAPASRLSLSVHSSVQDMSSSSSSMETESDDAKIRKEYRQSKSRRRSVLDSGAGSDLPWLQERYQNPYYEYVGLFDHQAKQQTANLFDIVRTALHSMSILVTEKELRELVANEITDRDFDRFRDGGNLLRTAIQEKLHDTTRELAQLDKDSGAAGPTSLALQERRTRLLHEKVMYMAQMKFLSVQQPPPSAVTTPTTATATSKDEFRDIIRNHPQYIPDPTMVVPILERKYEMKFIFLDGDRARAMPRSSKVASTSVHRSLAAESMFIDCEKSVSGNTALSTKVDPRRASLYKTYVLVERETAAAAAEPDSAAGLTHPASTGLASRRMRGARPNEPSLLPSYRVLFRLVSYKDKVLFSFEQLPYSLRTGIQDRCRQHSGGWFATIPDFHRLDHDSIEDPTTTTTDSAEQDGGGGKVAATHEPPETDTESRRQRAEMRRKRQEKVAASLPLMTSVQPQHAVLYVADFLPSPIPPGQLENELLWPDDPMQGLKYSAVMLYPDWRHRLSDSWQAPFFLDGHRWMSVEHYVQAMKYKQAHPEFYLQFTQESGSDLSKDPRLAKIAGESLRGLHKQKYIRPSHIPVSAGTTPVLVWGMEGALTGGGGGGTEAGMAKEVTLDDLRERALLAKFTQNKDLLDLLFRTLDACIYRYHSMLGEFEPDLELLMVRSHLFNKHIGV